MENNILMADEVGQEWLKGILREGLVTISFIKKDGTNRDMVCTLKESLIPEDHTPKGTERKKPTESLAVFDTEEEGWRSFRWDSVKTISAQL
jgi:hypothetical protein